MIDERDKNIQKEIARLKKANASFKERQKFFEKKLDTLGDEVTKLAIEEQALIASVKLFYDIGMKLAEKEGILREMMKDQRPAGPSDLRNLPKGEAGIG